ncbi:MAG: FHA domain-containing protein [Bdellovibrionota bacterium]
MSNLRFELRNKEQGQKIRLSGELIRVGRAEDNTVVLLDPSVSRYHVNLYPKESDLIVEDAGSKTGFFVNGIAQRDATALKNGDILKIGNQSFSVFISSAAASKEASPSSSFGGSPLDSSPEEGPSSKRRLILYGAVALFLVAIFLGGKKTEVVPLASDATFDADSVSKALDAKSLIADTARQKSRGEIEADGKFHEGMRDYNNENYVRAIARFEEALTQNPNMTSAADYLQFAQGRLRTQVKNLMQDGQRSYALLQYSRAKAQFGQVLSIMSEQIPGYWQQNIAPDSEDRKPAQEETLMSIPCDRTKEQATCKLAVELIKQSRQALGEEDTIR